MHLPTSQLKATVALVRSALHFLDLLSICTLSVAFANEKKRVTSDCNIVSIQRVQFVCKNTLFIAPYPSWCRLVTLISPHQPHCIMAPKRMQLNSECNPIDSLMKLAQRKPDTNAQVPAATIK